ncbi:MAG: family transposase [Gammaproteobacteria bacterium]|nr:family transposase [Gammaproteobacteria bacterium]
MLAEEAHRIYDLSTIRSCDLFSIRKTAYYYESKKDVKDAEISAYLLRLADEHNRWGFDKMILKVKADEKPWNHKRVYRLYCENGLNLRIKARKRIPKGEAKALVQPIASNVCWSADCMSDALECGRKFRTFNILDDYNRECLLVEPRYSMPAKQVIELLEQVAIERGYPEMIRVDHGAEFESGVFKNWAKENQVLIQFIQPGKLAQNGFIERFNRTYREDVLDMNWFRDIAEVRQITKAWINTYNEERPHESLAGLSPVHFAQRCKQLTGKTDFSTL